LAGDSPASRRRTALSEATTVRVDDDVQLGVESMGAVDDPALLLIGGATWSMD